MPEVVAVVGAVQANAQSRSVLFDDRADTPRVLIAWIDRFEFLSHGEGVLQWNQTLDERFVDAIDGSCALTCLKFSAGAASLSVSSRYASQSCSKRIRAVRMAELAARRLPSSLGESSGVELLVIFVGEDVGGGFISRKGTASSRFFRICLCLIPLTESKKRKEE